MNGSNSSNRPGLLPRSGGAGLHRPLLARNARFGFPPRVQRARRLVFWLPMLAWMAMIFVGSTGVLADSRTSRFLAPLLRWLGFPEAVIGDAVLLIRKGAHAGEYGVLMLLTLVALTGSFRLPPLTWSWRRAGVALAICAAYAASDEIHQAFEPDRFGSVLDVGIDTLGAALALAAMWAGTRLRRSASLNVSLPKQERLSRALD